VPECADTRSGPNDVDSPITAAAAVLLYSAVLKFLDIHLKGKITGTR
jgi:hypothetical protein